MQSRICGLALLFAVALTSAAPPARADEVPIGDEARAHFNAGVNLLQDPDGARYEEAYREFKAAYAASPSWKILGNLGITAMKLERDGEAIDAFKQYLAEGGSQIEPDEQAQIQRDLATLEAGVVRVTVGSNPPGAVILDERFPATGPVVRNSYGPLSTPQVIGLHAGRHRITAKLAGREDTVWEVELSPRQQLSHEFVLPESAPDAAVAAPIGVAPSDPSDAGSGTSTLRIASYVALGVGVVGVGAGTLFGLQAKSNYDDGNELCPDFPCYLSPEDAERREEFGDDGDSAKTLSLVSFIVGGAGLATGVTLFVLSGNQERPTQARVEPFLGLGAAGVRGRF